MKKFIIFNLINSYLNLLINRKMSIERNSQTQTPSAEEGNKFTFKGKLNNSNFIITKNSCRHR